MKTGDVAKDGTIYLGCYEGRDWFAASEDIKGRLFNKKKSRLMTFNAAARHVKRLKAHGHNDWQMPDFQTLGLIHANRDQGALSGTFNNKGKYLYKRSWLRWIGLKGVGMKWPSNYW